jgi:hypothetical protein
MCVLFFASSLHHTVKRPASVEVFMHACSCMSNFPVMVSVHEWVCACLCVFSLHLSVHVCISYVSACSRCKCVCACVFWRAREGRGQEREGT